MNKGRNSKSLGIRFFRLFDAGFEFVSWYWMLFISTFLREISGLFGAPAVPPRAKWRSMMMDAGPLHVVEPLTGFGFPSLWR